MRDQGIRVEPLGSGHLTQVCRLERVCFDYPWSPESFRQEVARMDSGGGVSRVVVEGGRVRAYSIAWFVLDEGHLGNLAVSPRHRGRGFARALMEDLMSEAERRKARSVWLEVRTGNRLAIRLYEFFRFRPVTVRRNYYTSEQEDALVMVRHMDDPGAQAGCSSPATDRSAKR